MASNQTGYLDQGGLVRLVDKLVNAMMEIQLSPFYSCGLFGEWGPNNEGFVNSPFSNTVLNMVTKKLNDTIPIDETLSFNTMLFGDMLHSFMSNVYSSYFNMNAEEDPSYIFQSPTSQGDIYLTTDAILNVVGLTLDHFRNCLSAMLPVNGPLTDEQILNIVSGNPVTKIIGTYVSGQNLKSYHDELTTMLSADYLSVSDAEEQYLTQDSAYNTYATITQITNLTTKLTGKQNAITYGTTAPRTLSTGEIYVQYISSGSSAP